MDDIMRPASRARKLWDSLDEPAQLFILAFFLGLFLGVLTGSFDTGLISFAGFYVPMAIAYIHRSFLS